MVNLASMGFNAGGGCEFGPSQPRHEAGLRRPKLSPTRNFTMTNAERARSEYRYEKLTWPEINDAAEQGKVCIVPCGAVEQHGHHLPLDVDLVCPLGVAHGAGRTAPEDILVLPVVAYGYTGHVMDFP